MFRVVYMSVFFLSYRYRTKYLGGHSDICVGVLTARTLEQWTKLNRYKTTIGSIMVSDVNIMHIALVLYYSQ